MKPITTPRAELIIVLYFVFGGAAVLGIEHCTGQPEEPSVQASIASANHDADTPHGSALTASGK
jgi:hypothetical protein